MSETTSTWPTLWVRASLDLAILGSLRGGPLHGYAVAQALQARGFGLLRGGSLYPALNRLQEAGYVRATWQPGESGPGRRDYALTGAGTACLEEGLRSWRELTAALHDAALQDDGATRHDEEGTA
ncbi:PadR family transcriptional regulator [Ornithinimicrobium panacihumi]|uniref:PadR family transcriptional regulator n=1 Tax=Ornithinimicrobium panacihumi TaxID=2008449 RepID=UPI003F8C7E97